MNWKEFLKPTRVKIIISILGWISIGFVFLHFLSGVYGGTSNFPAYLLSLFKTYELISYFIFPFTLLTVWLLYPLTVIFLNLIMFVLRLPLNVDGILHPAYLTIFGAVITFPLLFIEWYLVSCLIVWFYDKKIKKSRGKKK